MRLTVGGAEGAIITVSALRREGGMAAFLVTGAIVGILLGLRFKVLVLVPASVLASVVIIISQSGHQLSMIVLTLAGTVVSLQMGYIVGSVFRSLARPYLPEWMCSHRSRTNC
jgi:hypothetical protein